MADPLPSGWPLSRRSVQGQNSWLQAFLANQAERVAELKAAQAGEPVKVIVVVAEAVLRNPRPLDEEADFMLIGHADAAVHLNGFVCRAFRHLTQFGFCGTRKQGDPV